ncbi:hypothetical protein [Microbacterium trichothecenolyticum]|uniref:Uncharacterized protein n=1 Tax=Microbacterium trichothecenolyticum TaxID=69370 RepID=A0A0M2H134_MICTR|nr:hypothetical protein [Microbacterium trichothecenolyticum]KJL39912.1 hypothetical protein RS82_04125 [Microbacterium trichothecenolyticum]
MATTLPEVSADEIPKYWAGDIDDFDVAYLQGKLGEVVDMIADRYGSLVAARLASGRLTERLYTATVIRIAARVWSNVDGFRRENAGQYGYEVNAAVASGTIWFTDDDVRDLTGVHPKQSNVIGTATIGRHEPGRTR